ncbi:hypothetical protein [Desulfosoma caldarium]|uniref:Uncharacterized protein n=1 Tax=Desulfosoma caldarium TaxID=610254 RepID=A0A3N1V169_9BACT|nr:hypothetical protein [Desulfosoma caldarium]ROQ93286.1 hypothetical protein EDC27_1298 [Desulfosoma caldarium]
MEATMSVGAWFGYLFLWTLGLTAALWTAQQLAAERRPSRRK